MSMKKTWLIGWAAANLLVLAGTAHAGKYAFNNGWLDPVGNPYPPSPPKPVYRLPQGWIGSNGKTVVQQPEPPPSKPYRLDNGWLNAGGHTIPASPKSEVANLPQGWLDRGGRNLTPAGGVENTNRMAAKIPAKEDLPLVDRSPAVDARPTDEGKSMVRWFKAQRSSPPAAAEILPSRTVLPPSVQEPVVVKDDGLSSATFRTASGAKTSKWKLFPTTSSK